MKNQEQLFGILKTSVDSEKQINVVIFFPTDDENFNKSLSIFETLCRGFHFPNYSYLEMNGKTERNNVKTLYFLFCDKWNEKKQKLIKNFDLNNNNFRNYDFLDFKCEIRNGGYKDAKSFLQKLQSKGQTAIGIIDQKDIIAGVPTEKEILQTIWGDNNVFENLSVDKSYELKCRLEHQHWCSDKLLNGFRELNKEELKEFSKFRLKEKIALSESEHWSMHKEMHDKKRLYATMKKPAHLDLCSFDELIYRDFSTIHYDKIHFEQVIANHSIDESKSNWMTNLRFQNFHLLISAGIVIVILSLLCCYIFGIQEYSLGIIGTEVIISIILWAYLLQNKFDKYLSNFSVKSFVWVFLFVISIPITATVVTKFDIEILDNSLNNNDYWIFFKQFVNPGAEYIKGGKAKYIVAFLGTLCINGFLIPSVINFIQRRVQNWQNGKTRYNFNSAKHVVIIGGHDMVPGILTQIDRPELKYIVIMTEQDCESYRVKISAQVSKQIADKLIIYHGDRTSYNDIKSLNIQNQSLQSVYIIGEGCADKDLESNHDSKNMTCADIIANIRKNSSKDKLRCFIMFEHHSSYVAFQQSELTDVYKKHLMFEPFNIFEMCAQNVLVTPQGAIRPIDVSQFSEDLYGQKRYIDMDSGRRVHLIVFGMSKIGLALASEAAIICHYPNYAKAELLEDLGKPGPKKEDLRMRITFIDLDAEQKMKFYQNRMPSLFEISTWKYMNGKNSASFSIIDNLNKCPENFEYSNLIDKDKKDKSFIDVEWEFISGALGDIGISKYLKDIVNQDNEILTIAVCLPKGEEGLSLASTMPVDVYDKAEQILVYQQQADGIVKQMAGNYQNVSFDQKANRFGKLRTFGMYNTCFNQKLLDNEIATKIFSNNYKKLKFAINNNTPTADVQLEDLSSLPILERWSAVYSAHNWSVKFRSMGALSGEIPTKEQLEKEFGDNSIKIEGTANRHSDVWGRVEHNRWNLERLIKIGERPITASENKSLEFKESYKKSAQRSHLNICSMKHLYDVDEGVIDYDRERNYRLVEIYDALINN